MVWLSWPLGPGGVHTLMTVKLQTVHEEKACAVHSDLLAALSQCGSWSRPFYANIKVWEGWRNAQSSCVGGISFSCPVIFPLQQSSLSPPDPVFWRYTLALVGLRTDPDIAGTVPEFPFPVLNTLFLAREKCVSYCLLRKPKLKLPSRWEGCAFRLIQMTLLSVENMTFSLKSNFPVWEPDPKFSCSGVFCLRLGFTYGSYLPIKKMASFLN